MSEQVMSYSEWQPDYFPGHQSQGLFYDHGIFPEYPDIDTIDETLFNSIPEADDNHQTAFANVPERISSPDTVNPVRITSPGKPKRSRRSKSNLQCKSTTFLNASIKDFRALVQQHTGCHSVGAPAQMRKGPITLCFASASNQLEDASSFVPVSQRAYLDHQFNQRYYSQ